MKTVNKIYKIVVKATPIRNVNIGKKGFIKRTKYYKAPDREQALQKVFRSFHLDFWNVRILSIELIFSPDKVVLD